MFNQGSKFWIDYVKQNEISSLSRPGENDLFTKNIYNSFNYFTQYRQNSCLNVSTTIKNRNRKNHGPIFDLRFSPDGKLLAAGTEENALLIFDPMNHQLINQLDNAHENSINHIKFLDSNFFATCSNDRKIAIWDIRKLGDVKDRLKTLDGHSHFVKNLEYDPNLRYLISSGFDGSVFVWNIHNDNSSSSIEPGFIRQPDCTVKKILSMNCLMRMRLTHDHTKMIISTVEGYIMVIHDLNLTTFKEDLGEFQSDLYRLMQKKHSSGFDFGSWYNSVFRNERNRVELISDFPIDNEAHLIGSLDVHPQGWCILSRNLSRDENSEWTCVHNIQDYEKPNEMMSIEMPKTNNIYFPYTMFKSTQTGLNESNSSSLEVDHLSTQQNSSQTINRDQPLSNEESIPDDLHISPLIIISARSSSRRGAQATLLNPNTSYRRIKPGMNPKIYCNLNRITHYIEESNEHKLLCKESHFSHCGRLIVSPHNENPSFGFRLLSFTSDCNELSDQILDPKFRPPHPLNVVNTHFNHSNFVSTVNFSPTHHLIVSGCLDGQINFYQPII